MSELIEDSALAKALDKRLGRMWFGDVFILLVTMGLALPFLVTFAFLDEMKRVSPLVSEGLLELATQEELPVLREMLCAANGRPSKRELGMLLSRLRSEALARAENRALASLQCS